MSKILTDQGFVEVGGELTHWDKGYIKQGHKWITRKMKNGKWVYTYKDAKADVNKYRDQVRTNRQVAKEHSNQAKYYNYEARRYDELGLDASERSAEYRRNTRGRRALVNERNKYAELASKNKTRGNEELRKARTAYQNSEDAKRMQASAQRVANEKRDAKPTTSKVKQSVRNRKRKISNWLKERKAKRRIQNE